MLKMGTLTIDITIIIKIKHKHVSLCVPFALQPEKISGSGTV